jgi:hypothetical protein
MVAQTSNLSYLGDQDLGGLWSRSAQAKSSRDPISTNGWVHMHHQSS